MRKIQELAASINDGSRAANSFACEGRDGEIRSRFIRDLAAGLLCSASGAELRPCGKCPSCLQAYAGTSMDIVHMSKSPGASRSGRETYKTENAAAFIERLSMGSYGRYLIGIIDDADSLSETIQNKLLKTIEEPSPDTLILLGVSNRDNLLSTVKSRLSFVRTAEYSGYEEPGETEGLIDGSMDNADAVSETAAMYTGAAGFYEVRSALEKNVRTKEEALHFLDALEDSFRDLMITAAKGERSGDPEACACAIEKINSARMDVRRDMNHIRALKRLYLELQSKYHRGL